ncbi:NAD-dependent epimerase/dehydratase family protein [bacterium]|nr:NAD-dependent epimerase/dehydratase family protein [bacterium]
MPNRRQFLQAAAGTAGLLGLHASGLLAAAATAADVPRADRPLKFLFLGGTGFIGPHQIEYALARGHDVTMFNRGRRSGMYGDRVEELTGDRDVNVGDGLKALAGDRTWDVIVDNSGYVPRHVRDAVDLLGGRCTRYVYVSTVAAYPDTPGHYREDAELAPLADKSIETVNGETYGPLKAECDRIVQDVLGDRATIVRPTFIIGPGDRTDRFTYWVDRVHRGGDIVAPALAELAVQTVDVRDLCPWIVRLGEAGTPGAFNAAGQTWTRAGLLWAIRADTGVESTFHWCTPEVAAELEYPFPMLAWGETSTTFDNAASRAAGLDYRPLADSTAATLAWWREQPDERRANPRGWPDAELEGRALARLGG